MNTAVGTSDYREAAAWMRYVERTASDQQGEWAGGEWLLTPTLPRVYDANRVVVLERGNGLPLDTIIDAANEFQAALPHRMIEFDDPARGAGLAEAFRDAGWQSRDLVLMVRQRPPEGDVDTDGVTIVDEAMLAPARLESLRDESWVTDDSIAAEIIEKQLRVTHAVGATLLGVVVDGVVASYCEVYDLGDAGQIEAVATLPRYRRRGYSRRVVCRALEMLRDKPLVYLVADPDDWPQHFYARLGFDHAGRIHRFLLEPA